jgi:hypothetical protein
MSPTNPHAKPRWWTFGHMWLVVGGPLVVVVASMVTFYIAARGSDPIVDENYYQSGLDINKTLVRTPQSLAPAIQARNHAATGQVPPSKPAKP